MENTDTRQRVEKLKAASDALDWMLAYHLSAHPLAMPSKLSVLQLMEWSVKERKRLQDAMRPASAAHS